MCVGEWLLGFFRGQVLFGVCLGFFFIRAVDNMDIDA